MATWYYMHVGEEVGPLSTAELRKAIADGFVTRDTRLRSDKSGGEWMRAGNIPAIWEERKPAALVAMPVARCASHFGEMSTFVDTALTASVWIAAVLGIVAFCGTGAFFFGAVPLGGYVAAAFFGQMFAVFVVSVLLDGFADLLASNDRQVELLSEIAQNLKPGPSPR